MNDVVKTDDDLSTITIDTLKKWGSGEYLEEICDKFCVEYNDDVDCFVVSFKRPRDLMKSLNKMFRLIRFLLGENKKQEEQKENIQNGFGERNDMV